MGPVIGLSGSIPASGLFVWADRTGDGSVFVTDADPADHFDFQNGPDSIALGATSPLLFPSVEALCGNKNTE